MLLILWLLLAPQLLTEAQDSPTNVCLDGNRVDCGFFGITQEECEAKNCCWSPVNGVELPWCFEGSPRTDYVVMAQQDRPNGVTLTLELQNGSPSDISPLQVDVTFETEERAHVKIFDPKDDRWEVPETVLPLPDTPVQTPDDINYSFSFSTEPFNFEIRRKSDDVVIFSTVNGFIFRDQYLSVENALPEHPNIYGLGEHVHPLRLKEQYFTLWAIDNATPPDQNLYGHHPFYLEMRDGSAHGVFLRNSNGMDVSLRSESITYHVIGGILDFYFFVGPEPERVIQQYHELIGFSHVPPYWSLGWHQCRYGFHNISEVEFVVQKYAEEEIPLETIWIDIDYMDKFEDFSTDPVNFPLPDMQSFVAQVHENNQKMVVIIDPAIHVRLGYEAFDKGVEKDIFVKNKDGEIFIGAVWPGSTAFPDWTNPDAAEWWETLIVDWQRDDLNVDGIWIDMNEAASFCDGECRPDTGSQEQLAGVCVTEIQQCELHGACRHVRNAFFCSLDDVLSDSETCWTKAGFVGRGAEFKAWEDLVHCIQNIKNGEEQKTIHQDMKNKKSDFDPNNPPYAINNLGNHSPLNSKTIDMDAQHVASIEYNVHNLFGVLESILTKEAVQKFNNERAFVLSRSTFAGSGHHVGHWLGDNHSLFADLAQSVPGILDMNMFGVSFTGPDVCGFQLDTFEELCARWSALGAFYTFARNHNAIGSVDQWPFLWESVTDVSKKVLKIRYELLPFMYTLMFESSIRGGTVQRPLFFEFPDDEKTLDLDDQFLFSTSFMVSPVLEEGAVERDVYFPSDTWYSYWTGEKVANIPGSVTLDAKIEETPILLHVRGGSLIPRQGAALTTEESRSNPFNLLIALDEVNSFTGSLFLDDGLSLEVGPVATIVDYFVTPIQNGIQIDAKVIQDTYSVRPRLEFIDILGAATVSSVSVNGANTDSFEFSDDEHTLTIDGLGLEMQENFSVVVRF